MTKQLKELVENAKECRKGNFTSLLIIPTGRKYRGFWGVNGYNSILLLGYEKEANEWYKITDYADVFTIVANVAKHKLITFDIPSEYNCVRVHAHDQIFIIDNELDLSDVNADIN